MHAIPQVDEQRDGFKGAILGLPLADVLQLKQQNRFSGCVTVSNANRAGKLFFRAGALIHAELADCEGEDACYRMLSWTGGQFEVDTKVNTTRHTIDKPLSFLLLETCRLMDEQRLIPESSVPNDAGAGETGGYIASVLGAFGRVSEVCGAAVTDRKGQLQHSEDPEDRQLATDGEFLSLVGRRLGQLLDLGELQQAAFRSRRRQVISVRNRSLSLHVAFDAGQPVEKALGVVRATLKSVRKG